MATKDIIAGFAYGFLSMIAFGFYGLPRKLSQMSQRDFMVYMSLGVLIGTSLIGLPRVDQVWSSRHVVALSYLGGILWYLGGLMWIKAIDCIGYGSATAIKNTTCIFATIIGIVLFNEYAHAGAWRILLVVLGSVLVSVSAILLLRTGTERNGDKQQDGGMDLFRGVALALGAAVFFALYTVPGRFVNGNTAEWGWQYYCLVGQGVFLAGLVTYGISGDITSALRESLRERLLGILSGLLFGVAFALMMTSMNLVGMAVGFSLANLNIVIVLPLSILIVKEVDYYAQKRLILLGVTCAVIGTVCLALSKG